MGWEEQLDKAIAKIKEAVESEKARELTAKLALWAEHTVRA